MEICYKKFFNFWPRVGVEPRIFHLQGKGFTNCATEHNKLRCVQILFIQKKVVRPTRNVIIPYAKVVHIIAHIIAHIHLQADRSAFHHQLLTSAGKHKLKIGIVFGFDNMRKMWAQGMVEISGKPQELILNFSTVCS